MSVLDSKFHTKYFTVHKRIKFNVYISLNTEQLLTFHEGPKPLEFLVLHDDSK